MSDRTQAASAVPTDEQARFAELYDAHLRAIRAYCRRRLAGHLVDDAVAEIFLTAWRRIDDVPQGDQALVWLYAVAYRVVGHQWRSLARHRRLEERLRSLVHRPDPTADESIDEDDDRRLVLAAAARLGDTDAEVLRLSAWEHLPIAAVAAVLQIDPNAVKQRLHRARQNLAREFRRMQSLQMSTPIAPTGGVR